MSLDRGIAVCLAEFRSTVRRVRTLVFVAVAAAGLVGTIALASLATSEVAPLAGVYAPRFVLSAIGNVWLWLFLIATVFMAFDARQQDERARVAEVLDAKPVSNLALLGGRLAATVAVAWLALVGIAALIQAGGMVSRMVHEASGNETASLAWWLAVTVEPASLVTLLAVDALPGLVFVTALVLFLAAALRRRALTIVVALAVVALHGYAVANVPMFLLPAVSLVASYANFASDVVPTFADPAVLVQRAALVLFAAALLTGAAALHPRDDGGARPRRGIVAILLAAVGGAAITGVVAAAASDLTVREEWLAAQEAARDLTFPDLRHVRGEVRIEPDRDLAIDLELRLAAPPDAPLERLHFSLNPGVEVSAVEIAGEAANTTHVDGILTVDLRETLAPATELSLSLRANGVPDERFAYLDSTVDWRRLPASNKLVLLGTDALVFSGAYVALTPGAAWLPTAGPNLADRSPDTFTADLVVRVPETWLVAGPGRRETVAPGVFRFRPATMVPDVGLFVARFERRAVEAGGVTLELLVVPEHAGHLDGLGEVMEGEDGIIARVGEMLDTARDQGLPYPYAGLSMVEIPARLRRYGGGRHWTPPCSRPDWCSHRIRFPDTVRAGLHGSADQFPDRSKPSDRDGRPEARHAVATVCLRGCRRRTPPCSTQYRCGEECNRGPGRHRLGRAVPRACRPNCVAVVRHGIERAVHGPWFRGRVSRGQPVAVARLGRRAVANACLGRPAIGVGGRRTHGVSQSRRYWRCGAGHGCSGPTDRPGCEHDLGSLRSGQGGSDACRASPPIPQGSVSVLTNSGR